MSLLDIGAEESLSAAPLVRDKPKAEPKFSAWSAVPRGIGEAGVQVGATAADLWGSFKAVRDATPEQRKLMDRQGAPIESYTSETGTKLRTLGESFRTDPADASVADAILYGFARGATKVVGGAVLGGLPGIGVMGVEEAITQADELRRQGVGVDARMKAGAAQGAGLALAALPAAGQTLAGTAALVAAGGPGGFMAQQALTRQILRDAGHDKVAESFDPFDPVGLAVSTLIPAGFGAYGLRANKIAAAARRAEEFRAGPVPSEPTPVAAAAAQAAGPFVPPDVVDAARVSLLAEHLARVEEAAAPRPVESLADFVARTGAKPYEPPKPPSGPDGFTAWVKSQGGIDFGQKLDITGDASGVRNNPAGIFRSGGLSTDDLATRAVEAGYLPASQEMDSGAFVDLVKRAVAGERVRTLEEQMHDAAMQHEVRSYEDRLSDLEQRAELLGVDPAVARGNADVLDAYLREHEPRLLAAAVDELQAARGADSVEFEALQSRARVIAQDIEDGGRTLAQYEAEVQPLSPVMRRLVSAELEANAPTTAKAPDPQGSTAPRGAGDSPAAAADAGRSAAGVQAAGTDLTARIERMLADTGRMTPETRGVYAGYMRAFYETLGARLGMTADEAFSRYGFTVRATELPGNTLLQAAYHGTPYRGITKFDTSKIGTGEGAQAYGWGLYFASKRDIAEHYRQTLSQERGLVGGQPLDASNPQHIAAGALHANGGDRAAAIAELESALSSIHLYPDGAGAVYSGAVELLRSGADVPKYEPEAGQVYKVEVPDDAHLLLWDKPLSEQPAAVREALINDDTVGQLKWTMRWDGKDIYEALSDHFAKPEPAPGWGSVSTDSDGRAWSGQQRASEALAALGIKGIKYLDGTSRGAGDGTFNYVVFSGEDVAIKGQFYQDHNRGAFDVNTRAISILEGADRSTFIHESGHLFLEVYADIAGRADAPVGIVRDVQALMDWFGVKSAEDWRAMSIDEQRPYHEQFARGMERFIAEGKAPTPELQSIFTRMAEWLKQVYRSLLDLNVDLTPEVRDVMGRMLDAKAPEVPQVIAADPRMAAIEAQHPNMPVMLDGMDAPMRLVDFLAAVKAEADDMAADAPLMEIAAQCALVNGVA